MALFKWDLDEMNVTKVFRAWLFHTLKNQPVFAFYRRDSSEGGIARKKHLTFFEKCAHYWTVTVSCTKIFQKYLKLSTEMGQLLRHTCYLCYRNKLALDIKLCMELLRSREFELNGFINYAYMVDRMELPQHHEVSYMCRTGDVNVAEQVTCEHHSNNVQV